MKIIKIVSCVVVILFSIHDIVSARIYRDLFDDAKVLDKGTSQGGIYSWFTEFPLYHYNDLTNKRGDLYPAFLLTAIPTLALGGGKYYAVSNNDEIGGTFLIVSPIVNEMFTDFAFFGPTLLSNISWKRALIKGNCNVSLKIGSGLDYYPNLTVGFPLFASIMAGTNKKRINYTFRTTFQNVFSFGSMFMRNSIKNKSAIQVDHTWTFNYPSGVTYAVGIDTGYEFSYTNQAYPNMDIIHFLSGAFSISFKYCSGYKKAFLSIFR